jgi:DNA-binding NarL/FixJ family response regulator
MISISVICDQEHDRKTIAAILSQHDDFQVVHTGADGYDALISARTQQPDVIIMDFTMKDSTGPDITPAIKCNSPLTAIIMLCTNECDAVIKALNAGISGLLQKNEGFDELATSVRSVYHGGLYLGQPLKNHSLPWLMKPAFGKQSMDTVYVQKPCIPEKLFGYTELRIFIGITLGHTDNEIAKNLNISTGAVRNVITRTREKTKLRNRTQMAILVLSVALMSRKNIFGQLAGIS